MLRSNFQFEFFDSFCQSDYGQERVLIIYICGQMRIEIATDTMRIDTDRIPVRNRGQIQIEIAAYRMQTEADRTSVRNYRQIQVKCYYGQDADRDGQDLLLQMRIFYPHIVFADRTDSLQLETDRNPIRFCPFLSVIFTREYGRHNRLQSKCHRRIS